MPPSKGRQSVRLASSSPSIRDDDTRATLRTQVPRLASSFLDTIQRRAFELQQHLQDLLNDQSELLAAPVPRHDDSYSSQSSQSQASSRARNGKVVPVRQPISNESLPAIRKELEHAMNELATLRHEEAQHVEHALRSNEDTSKAIALWQDSRRRLESEMEALQDTHEASRLDRLQQDDSRLNQEINALELQLTELRSKQRIVRSELSSLGNTVQSRMSSYRASMDLLDREVQTFLTSQNTPRSKTTGLNGSARWMSQSQAHAPASSLDDIAASNSESAARLLAAHNTAMTECQALNAGVQTWRSVNTSLRTFERQLAGYLRLSRHDHDPTAVSSYRLKSSARSITKVELLELMNRTLEELEEKLSFAEDQGWKLLVCAIGAEVQAFTVGRDVLNEMLHDQDTVGEHDETPMQDQVRKRSLRRSTNGSSRRDSSETKHSDPHDSSTSDVHSPVRTYIRRREKPYLAGSGEEDGGDDEDTDADAIP
jgi:hypothetical protein